MKKKKRLITAAICFIIVIGIIGTLPFTSFIADNKKHFFEENKSVSAMVSALKNGIDYKLYYKYLSMDIKSYVYQKQGKRELTYGNKKYVLTKEDYIARTESKIEDDEIDKIGQKVLELKKYSNQMGADFLYVYAPDKNLSLKLPKDCDDNTYSNYQRLMKSFDKNGVETLDLASKMKAEKKSYKDMYFITDHHWTPEAGFWANGVICEELKNRYNFSYNKDYTNIDNYNKKVYKNWFLGNNGKDTGKYFSPLGTDDISLITPKFKTDLTRNRPFQQEEIQGAFDETVLDKQFIEYKNLHKFNTYAVYSSGDIEYEILTNNNPVNDDKILIIRDSYACTVTPFLSLNCKELHIMDVRDFDWFENQDKTSVKEYIEQAKPNYVIVLYNSVSSLAADGRYDFFK